MRENKPPKIIINCLDVINESMAGPAIRSWEFATQLSKRYEVVVLSPNKSKLKSKTFTLKQFSNKVLKKEMSDADFIISQKVNQEIIKLAQDNNTKIILDAYDPISLEALEANSHKNIKYRKSLNNLLLLEQSFSFLAADSIICASEKQRDFWLGVLSSMNKIDPESYDKDHSLRSLIDVVPFGLSSTPPVIKKTNTLRSKFGFSKEDKVLLWGGGIWDWFDPLSLIDAVANIDEKYKVKLVFMGIDHPNKDIPRMPMVQKAIQKATDLGVLDKKVFFNEGWVPYKERQQFLLDADIGVSTHYDHLETRFSFRTRMLDYIWAELPIVATQGDSFAELIEEKGLGEIVPYQNSQAIADAIVKLVSDKNYYAATKNNLKLQQKDFYWEKCVEPITKIIEFWSNQDAKKSLKYKYRTFSLLAIYGGQKTLVKRYAKKIIGPAENKARISRLYRSQNIIRRGTFKKAIGMKAKKKT